MIGVSPFVISVRAAVIFEFVFIEFFISPLDTPYTRESAYYLVTASVLLVGVPRLVIFYEFISRGVKPLVN